MNFKTIWNVTVDEDIVARTVFVTDVVVILASGVLSTLSPTDFKAGLNLLET